MGSLPAECGNLEEIERVLNNQIAESTIRQPTSTLDRLNYQRFHDNEVPLTIHVVMGMEEPVDVHRLRELLLTKVAVHPRFHSLLKGENQRQQWVPTAINLSNHIREVGVSERECGGEDPVAAYVNHLANVPLHENYPLWDCHVFSHPDLRGCSSTIVFRVHHAIGDGISLASLFLDLAETVDGGRPSLPGPAPPSQELPHWISRLGSYFMRAWNTCLVLVDMLHILLAPPDTPTPIKAPCNMRSFPKQIVMIKPDIAPVSELKKVAKLWEATLNDVLLGAVAHGLEQYIHEETAGSNPLSPTLTSPFLKIHGLIPVNLRPLLTPREVMDMLKPGAKISKNWGTMLGYSLPALPVGTYYGGANLGERVKSLTARTRRMRNSWEALVSNFLMAVICNMLGTKALLRFMYYILSQITIAVSNLPGPQEEVRFIGNRVVRLHQFVTGSPQGFSLHAISYAGNLFVTTTNAAGVIARPDALASCISASFKELQTVS